MRNKLDRINIFEFIRLWNYDSDLDKSRIKVKFLNNDLIDIFQADLINLKGLTGEIVDVVDYSNYTFVSIELDKHIERLKGCDNTIYFELSDYNYVRLKDLKVKVYRNDKFTDLFGRS